MLPMPGPGELVQEWGAKQEDGVGCQEVFAEAAPPCRSGAAVSPVLPLALLSPAGASG